MSAQDKTRAAAAANTSGPFLFSFPRRMRAHVRDRHVQSERGEGSTCMHAQWRRADDGRGSRACEKRAGGKMGMQVDGPLIMQTACGRLDCERRRLLAFLRTAPHAGFLCLRCRESKLALLSRARRETR